MADARSTSSDGFQVVSIPAYLSAACSPGHGPGRPSLAGRVLPIGSLKEKTLAAHRAGIKRVLVPERNKADLDEVPKEVRDELEFVFVHKLDEVLAAALERPPQPSQAYLDELAKREAAPSTN